MAEALAKGFAAANVASVQNMIATDLSAARQDVFRAAGITIATDNKNLVENSDVIFLCVKPYGVKPLLQEVATLLTEQKLIVSIAAGVTLADIQTSSGGKARCIRVMPNTPCMVGQTAAAMCLGEKATAADGELVSKLFNAVGRIYQVQENLLDAVTGLSGSGPAYVFLTIEALADGGVRAGLPRDIAMGLAAQTVAGAAQMVLQTGKHPGELKDMVTSPGGTTIAGIHALEKAGTRAAFMDAVVAATDRAKEMSKL